MERRVAVVATLAVAVALATVPTGGLAQSESASVAPGERFAGVISVQETEVQSAVDSRAFQVRFDRAESNASRAALVAERTGETRERLQELRERKERLREARENGSISEGQFQARMATVAAESNALQQALNRTADASREVPDEALREQGVERTEIERLRAAAGNLTGPEVAAMARNITGNGGGPPAGVGLGEARGPPEEAGPPEDRGGSDGADGQSGDDGAESGPPDDAGTSERDGDQQTDNGDGGTDRSADQGNGSGGDGSAGSGQSAGQGSSDEGDGESQAQ